MFPEYTGRMPFVMKALIILGISDSRRAADIDV